MPFDIEAAKKMFFDRAVVKNALDAGTRRALSKFGAFVRTGAQRSIRKRKGVSAPGAPPSSHTGVLRKGILFGFDPLKRSVVIGPVLAGAQSGAPERLEQGGPGIVGGPTRRRVAIFRPRPFMAPAFAAELPRAPQMFRDAVRK